MNDDDRVDLNTITLDQIKRGLKLLKENNIKKDEGMRSSNNPMVNMMNLFRGSKKSNSESEQSQYVPDSPSVQSLSPTVSELKEYVKQNHVVKHYR